MFPAVLTLTNRKALQGSQLLDVCQAARVQGKASASDNLSAWRNLQWLSRFKEWAIFGFLACPGEPFANVFHATVIQIMPIMLLQD